MDTSFENPEKNPTNVSFFSSLPAEPVYLSAGLSASDRERRQKLGGK
jgi:hypothetical protein